MSHDFWPNSAHIVHLYKNKEVVTDYSYDNTMKKHNSPAFERLICARACDKLRYALIFLLSNILNNRCAIKTLLSRNKDENVMHSNKYCVN